MTARTEVLRDRTGSGKEPLRLDRGCEPLPALLPLACRLVRVLRAILVRAMLARNLH